MATRAAASPAADTAAAGTPPEPRRNPAPTCFPRPPGRPTSRRTRATPPATPSRRAPSFEVDALEAYCAAYEAACGKSLTYTLWADYEASKAPLGIFMDPGLAGGGDIGDIRYTAMEQTDQLYLAGLNGDDTPSLKAGASEESSEIAACGGESFTAGTKVLLADGSTIPISQIKAGDRVLATDTRTGRTQPQPVTAVLVHYDTNLYDLRLKSAHRTAIIHTTTTHLFWNPHHHNWIPANKLSKGKQLKTPDGTTAVADGATTPKVHDGWMWDLTVPGNNDHDFYVLPAYYIDGHHLYHVEAGSMAVLVHNCSPFGEEAMQQAQDYASSAQKMEHVLDPGKHNFGDLIQAAGGRSEAMQQIVGSLSDGAGLPESGPFEVTRTIQGEVVTIRGAVVNGVPKIGTAFIP